MRKKACAGVSAEGSRAPSDSTITPLQPHLRVSAKGASNAQTFSETSFTNRLCACPLRPKLLARPISIYNGDLTHLGDRCARGGVKRLPLHHQTQNLIPRNRLCASLLRPVTLSTNIPACALLRVSARCSSLPLSLALPWFVYLSLSLPIAPLEKLNPKGLSYSERERERGRKREREGERTLE